LTLEPGVALSHYILVERIGEGGMGVVWKALDSNLGRHVALKVLPEDVAADPGRLAFLEHEARALAALNHPNIVTLHSVEEADGIRFITM
jgi:serine/threonine protein kinase